MRARTLVVVPVIPILLACSGVGDMMEDQIGNIVEEAVEKAIEAEAGGDVEVDAAEGELVVNTPEGTVSVGTGQLPADWPTDVPIYPGATVVASVSGAAAGGGAAVTAMSTDGAEPILAFYADKMSGWAVQFDASTPEGHARGYASPDGKRTVQLAVAGAGGQTSVTVTTTTTP
jgi:hypothetical protein